MIMFKCDMCGKLIKTRTDISVYANGLKLLDQQYCNKCYNLFKRTIGEFRSHVR